MNNSNSLHQENLLTLNATFSKLLKRLYGKGPENCFTTLYENILIVQVKNFATPAEETLIKNNNLNLAYDFRYGVMDTIYKEFAEEIREVLGLEFSHFSSDWNFKKNAGIIVFENENSNWRGIENARLHSAFMQTIRNVSANYHKAPSTLHMTMLNHKLFAIKCEHVLLKIEHVLYEQGYTDILRIRTREIREVYRSQINKFEQLFDRVINDIYMIWDYQKEQCSIFFSFQ
ncbi:DUF2294 domain-containing protein [Salirhabdus sp. Marseille-P4669]|uniref:DUF2294 domain-containing protein n=1 Tax=Salirhabdus sp. Marseille-P4669 TaxID=2042310 RepID=UPI000C7C2EE6|nr:Na-translocating system protein MpsC family protein [Salirhabdus sp. Marseille-P4669]